MQLLLPFPCFQVTPRHLEWFHLANAADYPERRWWFYGFKLRFLCQHAVTDGLDLQTIEKRCWCGDGIWRGMDDCLPKHLWQPCHKCGGTGIYLRKEIVLTRWLLRDHVFHTPSTASHRKGTDYRCRFEGLVTHGAVAPQVGRRSMDRLLLRYEPETFARLWMERWRALAYWRVKVPVQFHIRRVRELLSRTAREDVPF